MNLLFVVQTPTIWRFQKKQIIFSASLFSGHSQYTIYNIHIYKLSNLHKEPKSIIFVRRVQILIYV